MTGLDAERRPTGRPDPLPGDPVRLEDVAQRWRARRGERDQGAADAFAEQRRGRVLWIGDGDQGTDRMLEMFRGRRKPGPRG